MRIPQYVRSPLLNRCSELKGRPGEGSAHPSTELPKLDVVSFRNATGAAIYFPRGPVNKVYGKLDFARETAWHKFLVAYHKV